VGSEPAGAAEYAYNLQVPASKVAQDVFELHNLIMLVCLGIFIVVFGAMFYSLLKHRKSVGHKAAHFHENTTVEVIWTVIPFVILMGMAYPAAKVVIDMKDTSNPDMSIKVTGYQWKWATPTSMTASAFTARFPPRVNRLKARLPKGQTTCWK